MCEAGNVNPPCCLGGLKMSQKLSQQTPFLSHCSFGVLIFCFLLICIASHDLASNTFFSVYSKLMKCFPFLIAVSMILLPELAFSAVKSVPVWRYLAACLCYCSPLHPVAWRSSVECTAYSRVIIQITKHWLPKLKNSYRIRTSGWKMPLYLKHHEKQSSLA